MGIRIVIILLAVVGIAFAAFMLIGSNREEPDGEAEPPAFLSFLNTSGGAPRLVEEEISFPRNTGDSLGLTVSAACGTPSRLATVEITSGSSVRVAYQCQPSGDDCRGPANLCQQVVCLVANEGLKGSSSCPDNREFVGEADLSIGPERGRLTISPPSNESASVVLR